MVLRLATVTTLLLAALSETHPTAPIGHVLHEARQGSTRLLHKRGQRVDPDAIIPVKIGLTQSNLEQGYDRLMDVSHPTSADYGKHLSAVEVHELFAPLTETIDAVRSWIADTANVNKSDILHSSNKGWLAVDIPIKDAERIFQTQYYEHEDHDGNLRVGCDQYYLPRHIEQHIDYVVPGVKSSPPLKKRNVKRNQIGGHHGNWWQPHPWDPPYHGPWHMPPAAHGLPPALQDCARNITPICIRALYDIPKPHLTDSVNSLGLFEQIDTYAQGDLDSFYALYAPNIPNGTAPIPAFIDGAQAPVAVDDPYNSGESDIDITMALALIYPQTVTLYQVDDIPNNMNTSQSGFLNTFLDALDGSYCTYSAYGITGNSPGLDPVYPDPQPGGYNGPLQCGVYIPTRVVSISYGFGEANLPLAYQKRQCNEWMKLALQGVSVLTAPGDYGVGSFPGDQTDSGCISAGGQNQTVYNPDYLSSCPWITSVGATRLYDTQTILDPESVMQGNLTGAVFFASSGGFSNRYTAPAYQQAAVSEYFANHDPGLPYYVANADASNIGANGGVYNRAGRAFPDVSANGWNFRSFTNGTNHHWHGTSLSSPLVASMITLINEERTAVGKGPVGFINPVLYKNPQVFHDITNGSNPNCGSSGFPAVPGWDPSTGLGTPDYPKLLKVFMSLP